MRQSKMTATMMAKTYRSFLFLLLVLCIHYTTVAKHVYSDSFPTNDEFDFSILDVYNVHGSPYGGFGRATRSRMAALPLQLPGTVGEYNEQDKEMYMEVRDGDGRLFACRVYHEDELTPSSLAESMFNTAQLSAVASHRYEEDIVENQTEDKETQDSPGEETDTGLTDEAKKEEQVHRVLDKLNGICTQVHKGWWSYEWCHGAKVTQFHVHVEKGKVQQIQTESVTNLGVYASSKVYTEGDPEDKKEVNRIVAEKIKEIEGESDEDEPKELAVVVHEFEDGAMCEETGKPRRTQVKLKCCPLKSMNRLRRAVLFNGHPVASNIAAITKMQEASVCNYSIEVCTPVLCEGLAEAFEGNSLVAKEGTNNDNKLVTTPFGSPEKRENESIREMLAGTLRNVCLTFQNGGWYVDIESADGCAALENRLFSYVLIFKPLEIHLGGYMKFVTESKYVSFMKRFSLTQSLVPILECPNQYTFSGNIPRISRIFQTKTSQST
jgi:hypothetical protein